jgi:NAD+ synthase (glutamine-hydrolysing)
MYDPPKRLITLATCNLNQWSLDFDGNLERIVESCAEAKRLGANYRLGPELEVSGYGCEDHFYETDTVDHCWESLAKIFELGATDDGLLCDFGMPVLHNSVRYNCRILACNRRILQIRPKTALADSGNYRESRYFTAYRRPASGLQETMVLPDVFRDKFGQRTAPFGTAPIRFGDGWALGCESCEELWTPDASHIDLSLAGVDVVANGSGSHHELRKLNQRLELIVSATRRCGGVYLYANQRGCDGGRLYYDGGALIACNGRVLAQADQFSVRDVEVVVATVDLDEVRSYRASVPSFGVQAIAASAAGASSAMSSPSSCLPFLEYPDLRFLSNDYLSRPPTQPLGELRVHSPEEECCLGPACWLWDYLRRSGAAGFFLPLSGGADSSSVATIVGAMCCMVVDAAQHDPRGDVAKQVRRLCQRPENDADDDDASWVPASSQELANHVLHTTYMGTENSSDVTKNRAERLGASIGSYHLSITIDAMVSAVLSVFVRTTTREPRFAVHGGSMTQDLALQNLQARLRMVTAYLYAQLLPWVRGRASGFLLVLGSANVDEGLRGYMTKYDCSSADLNPIGAIRKEDLRRMLQWAAKRYGWPVLDEIAAAPPTAELRPMVAPNNDEERSSGAQAIADSEHSQLDEDEMGMTYYELGVFGTLRKVSRCGPVSMFRRLCVLWRDSLSPRQVADKVKRFFYYYSVNRHKMCTLTPSYHAEAYSPDDNRFDLRPFLYNVLWPRQFGAMDRMVESAEHRLQQQEPRPQPAAAAPLLAPAPSRA